MVAFFAGQNTLPVSVFLANYHLAGVPLYIVIVGSMLIGFFISWLVSLVDSVFNIFALRGKESALQTSRREIAALKDRIRRLEIENARLKGENNEPIKESRYDEEPKFQPSFFDRLRHSFH